MAEHPNVPRELTTAAIAASPALQRFYVIGGGSLQDLRTDMSHALAGVLMRLCDLEPEKQVIDLDRRRKQVAFTGPERRRRVGASL